MGGNVAPTLRQLLMTRFNNSNSTNINALTNLSEKALVFYRKTRKDLSKRLAEAVSELWKERTEAIKKLLERIKLQNSTEKDITPDQPTMESF